MTLASASATPDYTMGYGAGAVGALGRATAESHARHLLPYLRPGLRVLDCGCGPGTISVGLAEAVAPGELHGVDMEESQVDLARSAAEAMELENAFFHVGDATDLSFEDGYFDVIHCSRVLIHVPDTRAVLAEVQRVLKPGGIISCREMICESSFMFPDFGGTRRSWDMFEDLIAADDGHPQMGKEMKGHILEAGFENLRMSASVSTYSTPNEIAVICELIEKFLLSEEIVDAAVKYGAFSRGLDNDIRTSYSKLKSHPAAFCGIAYGEVIGNKPL